MRCGKENERFFRLSMKPNTLRCICGGYMVSQITMKTIPRVFQEYHCEQTDLVFTDPAQRSKLMKENGFEEIGYKGVRNAPAGLTSKGE